MGLEAATEPRGGDHARHLQTKTFGSLDGLRALAILAVLWHHTGEGWPDWRIATRGFLGVDLFFVISGFLIATLLLRERRRTNAISLRNFYGRRFLRIFPAYYFMLLVVGAMAFLKPGNTSAAVRHDLPYALLYLSNLVPMQSILAITWSLAVEEQFYIVVPPLEKYVRRGMTLLLAVLYVVAVLPSFGFWPGLDLPHFFRETTFGPILLGVLLAHVMDDPAGYSWTSRLLGWRWAPVIALALVVLACLHPAEDISGLPRTLIHFALTALVAACVVQERHALRGILASWLLRRIGVVSYGIYLYHLIVMHFVTKGMERFETSSHLLAFAVTTIATWGAAELSYRLFESRFLALKSRFFADRRDAPVRA